MSIYDRGYMGNRERRGGYAFGRGGARDFFTEGAAVKILIIINVAVFIFGAFFDSAFGGGAFFDMFALSPESIMHGKIWTLISYSFLHANILHIFVNMLALYFMGMALERWIGTKRFLLVYFAGALSGGLLWLALSFMHPEALVGASAAVMAVFACFCAFYPPTPITFLIFFVLPVSLRPMTMLKLAAIFECAGFALSLMSGGATIAYSAHLGGMLAGFLLAKKMRGASIDFTKMFSSFPKPSKTVSDEQKSAADYRYKVNISNREEMNTEVDRILDKINRGGFSSLTDDERELLKRARDSLK